MLMLRRCAAVVAGVLVAGVLGPVPAGGAPEAQVPPESSGEVEVTYLDVPDDSGTPPRTLLNGRGEVVTSRFTGLWRNPVSYLWRDGETVPFEPYTNVNDMSERGHVAGAVWEPDVGPEGARRPFVWFDGEQSMLPIGDAFSGEAMAVNDHGTAAGAISAPDNDGYESAVWRDGEILTAPVDLAPDEASFAVDINNRNQVLLVILGEEGPGFGLIYDRLMLWEVGGEVLEVGEGLDHGSDSWISFLTGDRMNEMGMVLVHEVSEGGLPRSYLWHEGDLTDLGSLGGEGTTATALNEWGQVVGRSNDANGDLRPFLWYQGEMTEIGIPGDGASAYWPAAINNWGQVVVGRGAASDEETETGLFLWQNGRVLDLGELAEDVDDWRATFAPLSSDINDLGQVVGMGSYDVSSDDPRVRYVLWEVPPLWGYPEGL